MGALWVNAYRYSTPWIIISVTWPDSIFQQYICCTITYVYCMYICGGKEIENILWMMEGQVIHFVNMPQDWERWNAILKMMDRSNPQQHIAVLWIWFNKVQFGKAASFYFEFSTSKFQKRSWGKISQEIDYNFTFSPLLGINVGSFAHTVAK